MTYTPTVTDSQRQRVECLEELARAVVALQDAAALIRDVPGDDYIASRLVDTANVVAVMKQMLLEKVRAE